MAKGNTDERIVQLMLDSREFDQNAKKSIQSLDDLKKALEFEGASKGFENIERAAKKVDLSIMENGIQKVQNHFNLLETVATTTMERITNSAIDAGVSLVKSLSTDNISAGFAKFGQKTTSVATLVSQGYALEEVNSQLERLNWYTDETSYNFTDMVNNIAKFTGAGKGLTESVNAMQGIANWAALSGQNAVTASRAMYQISQAMSSGVMRKEDWRSIQNANMDTQEFRQHALDAAVALGTLRKNANGTYQSLMAVGKGAESFNINQFTEKLTEGAWFTSDVMMEVFNDYSAAVDQIYQYATEHQVSAAEAIEALGDELDDFGLKAFNAAGEARTWADVIDSVKDAVSTGWMKTFEYIFGDYEEAKELFTNMANELYEVFMGGINARNKLLASWKSFGGRDILLEGFKELWKNVKGIIDSISEAWNNIFGKDFSEQVQDLINFTDKFYVFAQSIRVTDSAWADFLRFLESVFRTIKTVGRAFGTIGRSLDPVIRLFNKFAGVTLHLAANLAEMISLRIEDMFDNKAMQAMYDTLNMIAQIIEILGSMGLNALVNAIGGVIGAVDGFWTTFNATSGGISGIIYALVDVFQNLWNEIITGQGVVGNVATIIVGVLYSLYDLATTIVQKIVGIFTGKKVDTGKTFGEGIDEWLIAISNVLDKLNLEERFSILVNLINYFSTAIRNLLVDLSNADSKLRQTLDLIVGELYDFWVWFKNTLTSMSADDLAKVGLLVVLAQLVNSIATVNKAFGGLASNTGGLIKTLNEVVKKIGLGEEISIMDKLSGIFNKTKILQFGIAAVMLAAALNELNKLDYQRSIESLVLLGALFGILLVVFKKWNDIKKNAEAIKIDGNIGKVILEISASLFILSSALTLLTTNMKNPEERGNMLLSAATLVLGFVGLAKAMSILSKQKDLKKLNKAAGALMVLSGTLTIMAIPISVLGSIEIGKLTVGLISIFTLLVSLGVAGKLLENVNWKTLAGLALTFNGIAAALLLMSAAIFAMGMLGETGDNGMNGVVISLVLLGSAIGILGNVLKTVSPDILMSLSLTFISLSSSMLLMAAAGHAMNGANMGAIAISIVAFGAALAVLVGIMASVPGSVKILDAVSNAFLKFGAALLMVGTAIGLITVGLAGFTFLLAALGGVATQFGDEFPELINKGFDAFEIVVGRFLDMIPKYSMKITAAIVTIITAIQTAIWMKKEGMMQTVLAFALKAISVLVTLGDPIIDAFTKLMDILTRRMPDIKAAIMPFANGLGEAIVDILWELLKGLIKGVLGLLDDLLGTDLRDGFAKLVGDAEEGVLVGAEKMSDTTERVFKDTGKKGVQAFRDEVGDHSPWSTMIDSMTNMGLGLQEGANTEAIPVAETVGSSIGGTVVTAVDATIGTGLSNTSKKVGTWLNNMDAAIEGFSGGGKGAFGKGKSRNDFNIDDYDLFSGSGESYKKKIVTPFDMLNHTKELIENAKKTAKVVEEESSPAWFDAGEGLGSSMSSGAGSGVAKTAEKTAEEIVEEHLTAISNAYSRGVDALDVASSKIDLKDKLWNLLNKEPGEKGTDAEKAAYEIAKKEHQLEILNDQMYAQVDKITLAQATYQDKLNLLGSSAIETQQAYNEMVQQQYALLELYSQKKDLLIDDTDTSTDAFIAASQEIASWRELVDKGLITNEMALEAGRDKLSAFKKEETDLAQKYRTDLDTTMDGIIANLESTKGDLADAFGTIVNNTLSDAISSLPEASGEMSWSITSTVADALDKTRNDSSLIASSEGLGADIANGAVNGLDKAKDLFVTASNKVAKDGLSEMADTFEVNSPSKKTYRYGVWLDEGLANGLSSPSGTTKVLNAASAIASKLLAKLKSKLKINSPSEEGYAIGDFVDQGIANGITGGGKTVLKSATTLSNSLLDTMKDEFDQNGKYVDEYLKNSFGLSDTDLRIQVIVDADTSLADESINELQRAYALKTNSFGVSEKASTFNMASTNYILSSINEQSLYTATKLQELYNLLGAYVSTAKRSSDEKKTASDEPKTFVTYNQTNISPKPISALDTYRNTQKQLSSFQNKVREYRKI